MKYLLDTNMVSYYLRNAPATVSSMRAQPAGSLGLSAISVAELVYGVERLPPGAVTQRMRAGLKGVLSAMTVAPLDHDAAEAGAHVRALLERKGVAIGFADALIAGQALALDVPLVSSDRVFKQVKGLAVRDWSK